VGIDRAAHGHSCSAPGNKLANHIGQSSRWVKPGHEIDGHQGKFSTPEPGKRGRIRAQRSYPGYRVAEMAMAREDFRRVERFARQEKVAYCKSMIHK
jgi:hypothetical protein